LSPRFKNTILLACIITACVISACKPARNLKAGEYLLVDNEIIGNPAELEKEEIKSYIKQKPNRQLIKLKLTDNLGFRLMFHLGLHNSIDEQKMKAKKKKRDNKIKAKNEKREAKGKAPKNKEKLTWREWVRDIGEAPVVLDSVLMQKSTKQIKLLLNNKGYFNSTVRDSVSTGKRKNRTNWATVHYIINPGTPYKVRSVKYRIEDELLAYYIDPVHSDTTVRAIQPGQVYDVDKLQAERERITNRLKNEGFYYFTREYIYFRIDSNLNSRQVDVIIGVKKFAQLASETGDSIVETNHQRYYVNKVFINTDFSPGIDTAKYDTTYYHLPGNASSGQPDYIFLHKGKLKYRPFVIVNELDIRTHELYQATNAEATYKRLADLKAFKLISIRFVESGSDKLDCYIQLTPVLRQSYTLESEGTNSAGNLGIAGSIVYQNNNTIRAAEILEIKLKGGIEAQKLINETGEADNDNLTFFNTIEFGPEVSLNIPRPLISTRSSRTKRNRPKTAFITSYNFQQRPEYKRSIYNLSYARNARYEFKNDKNLVLRHSTYPVEINFIKVDPTASFEEALAASNNLLLKNQFTNHMTTSTRWVGTLTNQGGKRPEYFFLRFTAESSGNALRWLHQQFDATPDTTGSYRIFNVIFSQYLRFDVDFRKYWSLNEHNKFVFRLAGGEGFPYGNLNVLPFERSFFAGGSNSIRAWRARSLGPGSFQSSFGESFDQIGDIQLEGNLEFRFNVIKMVNAAMFIDFGNIWLRKPDPKRLNAEWEWNRFYKEIAIGSGGGVRVDFDFFIIRLDAGLKLYDPKFGESGRVVLGHFFDKQWRENYKNYFGHEYSFINFNLGIGYPF
jgi:outer membrane protein assembly factor BamA